MGAFAQGAGGARESDNLAELGRSGFGCRRGHVVVWPSSVVGSACDPELTDVGARNVESRVNMFSWAPISRSNNSTNIALARPQHRVAQPNCFGARVFDRPMRLPFLSVGRGVHRLCALLWARPCMCICNGSMPTTTSVGTTLGYIALIGMPGGPPVFSVVVCAPVFWPSCSNVPSWSSQCTICRRSVLGRALQGPRQDADGEVLPETTGCSKWPEGMDKPRYFQFRWRYFRRPPEVARVLFVVCTQFVRTFGVISDQSWANFGQCRPYLAECGQVWYVRPDSCFNRC